MFNCGSVDHLSHRHCGGANYRWLYLTHTKIHLHVQGIATIQGMCNLLTLHLRPTNGQSFPKHNHWHSREKASVTAPEIKPFAKLLCAFGSQCITIHYFCRDFCSAFSHATVKSEFRFDFAWRSKKGEVQVKLQQKCLRSKKKETELVHVVGWCTLIHVRIGLLPLMLTKQKTHLDRMCGCCATRRTNILIDTLFCGRM